MSTSIITSVVTGGTNSHATVSEEANAYATDFVTQGVLGSITSSNGTAPTTGSFGVNQNTGSDMNLLIKGTGNTTSGYSTAYITCSPATQDIQVLRGRMASDYTPYAINSNATGSTVYDWIYLQANATNANTPDAAADNVIAPYTSRSTSNTADNGSPPTYGVLLAVVTVANGATAITNANIADKRTQVNLNTGSAVSTNGWTSLNYPLTFSSVNGNRSYSLTTPNNLTGVLSPGMRFDITRSVTPPTQCTSLNGTNQYWNRTSGSVAGMTFTNNFVVSAWVKLSSYNGSQMVIASRYNGTSGWMFLLNSSGQLRLDGYNAGSGNNSVVLSYQSVPLNKWVHVSAQLDMATFTATPTTSYVMIDGVDVPASVSRTGTNPTSLIQAGNLEIGSQNGGLTPFPGKIAQVAIYSAKVTEATIAASSTQSLVGTETNLISAYSFNNSINDLNANANNLTANNGAAATTADSPMNTIEYGIVTSVSFSNPTTTIVVQCPEGYCIPNMTLNSPQYSSQKVPFGFPAQKTKWNILATYLALIVKASPSASVWYNGGTQISAPIGEWNLGYEMNLYVVGTSTLASIFSDMNVANNTGSGSSDYGYRAFSSSTGTNSTLVTPAYRLAPLSLQAQTTYYLNFMTDNATTTSINFINNAGSNFIILENAYL